MVADTATNAAQATGFASAAEAAAYVSRAAAADPRLAGTIHAIPAYEAAT